MFGLVAVSLEVVSMGAQSRGALVNVRTKTTKSPGFKSVWLPCSNV